MPRIRPTQNHSPTISNFTETSTCVTPDPCAQTSICECIPAAASAAAGTFLRSVCPRHLRDIHVHLARDVHALGEFGSTHALLNSKFRRCIQRKTSECSRGGAALPVGRTVTNASLETTPAHRLRFRGTCRNERTDDEKLGELGWSRNGVRSLDRGKCQMLRGRVVLIAPLLKQPPVTQRHLFVIRDAKPCSRAVNPFRHAL